MLIKRFQVLVVHFIPRNNQEKNTKTDLWRRYQATIIQSIVCAFQETAN